MHLGHISPFVTMETTFMASVCFPEDQTLEGSVQNEENLLSRGTFFCFLHRPVSRKGGVLGEGEGGGGGGVGKII